MINASLIEILRARFAAAIHAVSGDQAADADPQVRAAGDARHGDYQCNAAMALAGRLKAKPRDIAQRIVDAVDLSEIAQPPEIAGPGFINIRLLDSFLAATLQRIPPPTGDDDDRLGLPPVENPQRIVVDYSSPNIAKQMHVGHLRSTIIGDVFARVLSFEGHNLVRQNHVGDWGTQFGMLIRYYREHQLPDAGSTDVLQAIEDDYRAAQSRFKSDPAFASEARQAVGELQSGDPDARRMWLAICGLSRHAFSEMYRRLGVLLTDDDICGESFYNDRLEPVVREVREKLQPRDNTSPAAPRVEARDDDGALCLFFYDKKGKPRYVSKTGDELPMIVRKSDGAFLYATTDLAAIRYRIEELSARRLIYVTDARQKLHFQMFFEAAAAIGWACDEVELEHVTFGSVLGADHRPLKTRDGQNIKLSELLDEAETRAYQLVRDRQDETPAAAERFSDADMREIAAHVGIASVKYADLRNDRTSDYVFSWDKMLAMQGNTAPYMMYAYARLRSISRKAGTNADASKLYADAVSISLNEPAERALALRLAQVRETIDKVAADLAPHVLCTYLYELASDLMRFYEACPVLNAPDPATRLSRLRLCDLTARTLRLSLSLLGISVVERM